MICSCRRPEKVWATWQGEDGKPVVVKLTRLDQISAPLTFSVHLGPLLAVDAVADHEGVRLELREFAEGAPG